MSDFRALLLEELGGKVAARIAYLPESDLPPGEVTVAVEYSTLNYKDGMILEGVGRLVRKYPHVPGVDFAGSVESSTSPEWKPGDKVVLTGWRVGEMQWGGYAQKARVKASQLIRLPPAISTKRAMAIGTAGFTSMMAVMALEAHGLKPGMGDVLVTGAAGGVGSVAVAILAKLGYPVAASTGRPETHDYLKSLGASSFIDRAELAKPPRQADRQRALGGRDRQRRQHHARHGADPDEIPRLGRGLRPGGRQRSPGQRHSLPAARGEAVGDRFRPVPPGRAQGDLGAAGPRPALGQARRHHPDHQARGSRPDGAPRSSRAGSGAGWWWK